MYPSLMLSVSVADEESTGACGEVWDLAEDLENFASDLHLCGRVRKGKANFSSLSPNELNLTIEQSDGWRHFILRYTLSRNSRGSRTALTKTVSGGFDLDPDNFGALVAKFTEFLTADLPRPEGQV